MAPLAAILDLNADRLLNSVEGWDAESPAGAT